MSKKETCEQRALHTQGEKAKASSASAGKPHHFRWLLSCDLANILAELIQRSHDALGDGRQGEKLAVDVALHPDFGQLLGANSLGISRTSCCRVPYGVLPYDALLMSMRLGFQRA